MCLAQQAHHVILLPYITNDGVMGRIIFMLLLHLTALNLQLIRNLHSIDVEAVWKRHITLDGCKTKQV